MESGRRIILVVDDDADVRSLAAAVVKELGYGVRTAADGGEALRVLREDRSVDLLFTDVVMPGDLSGFALARRAKALRPELRVIYATGYFDGVPEAASIHGPILSKPYRPAELGRQLGAAFADGAAPSCRR
jgi:CheY-like chemotaxis protein